MASAVVGIGRDVDEQPLVQEGEVTRLEGQFLHLLDEVVVLGVEHVVDAVRPMFSLPRPSPVM